MTKIQFISLPTYHVAALRNGAPDAYGQAAEQSLCESSGYPCRYCLNFVPKGGKLLTLAYRPFEKLQPYAETGPIFLCAEECAPWEGTGIPQVLTASPEYLLKGYTAEQRICYSAGRITAKEDITDYATELLTHDHIAFVDVRSAKNNCFLARIIRVT